MFFVFTLQMKSPSDSFKESAHCCWCACGFIPKNVQAKCRQMSNFLHSSRVPFELDPRQLCNLRIALKLPNRTMFLDGTFLVSYQVHLPNNLTRIHSINTTIELDPYRLSSLIAAHVHLPNRAMFLNATLMLIPHHVHLPTNLTCTQRKYRSLWRPHEHCEST